MSSLRVLVVQNGSRHNYAVPAVLERAGLLEAFYTDACGNVGIGRLFSLGRHLPVAGKRLHGLHNRRVPSAVTERTISFPLSSALDQALCQREICTAASSRAGRGMIRRGLGEATMIYSSLGWARPFLEHARRKGIKVVTEFYMRPSIWRTYQAEHRAFPGWEAGLPWPGLEDAVGTPLDPCTVSDFLIVPAEGVRDDVAREHKFPAERISVVPYGVGASWFGIQNNPIPGRVLFVGSCCLGKGIHYFAMAAERLKANSSNSTYEFRAVGNVTELVARQPGCRHLKFMGRVPRTQVWREYQSADVLVLPSLSEGSASATYEGLAAGVPVITTPAAGSVVRDGIEGRIMPERDPDALAAAIEEVVEDRTKRASMAAAARKRARNFTWERYGERLVATLKFIDQARVE
jgi:glycosyltransferase involved in cell wall biosynthesis